ncbi:hypothetical protein CFE70_007391 [Pyrenophora teres f. teres 0-1]|uniref:Uncharacterized protein n=2 Tax=Pyrenophora teres f. teres TaxID=97479 RepID=E3REX6_PYRTT|nr:hypothetical protein PTT_05279 [Pyrenophora teres f. teres 0-1]KAE8825667.1 hypothetical protein HRS9139_08777 [Pyrenophora teres f. teres]KAE8834764.1 hypothetical protein PTNB85_06097 [Pyrenophora teres f. teres]KAE8843758.1 hypothetical protein HRS9122_04861 [Pyrenophora teres f. teres]KAE8859184.1 hypothetical protein PTNB73_08664 [Pyrenophora teres f. teres]
MNSNHQIFSSAASGLTSIFNVAALDSDNDSMDMDTEMNFNPPSRCSSNNDLTMISNVTALNPANQEDTDKDMDIDMDIDMDTEVNINPPPQAFSSNNNMAILSHITVLNPYNNDHPTAPHPPAPSSPSSSTLTIISNITALKPLNDHPTAPTSPPRARSSSCGSTLSNITVLVPDNKPRSSRSQTLEPGHSPSNYCAAISVYSSVAPVATVTPNVAAGVKKKTLQCKINPGKGRKTAVVTVGTLERLKIMGQNKVVDDGAGWKRIEKWLDGVVEDGEMDVDM